MSVLRSVFYLMWADFLERIRRYSFLVVLLATVLAGYSMIPSIDAPYNAFAIGDYRPFYNSAWVGTIFGVIVATLVTLLGFYLIRDAVRRDYKTRVGQIIATTPVSKPLYILGKWLSNLAVLISILAVLTVVALVMQLVRAEDMRIDLWALVAPMWFMGLPVLALVSALAVLFESLPILKSGIGNVIYLALWCWALLAGPGQILTVTDSGASNDLVGLSATMVDIRQEMLSLGYDPGAGVTDLYQPTGGRETVRFVWNGINWTFGVFLQRLLWFCLAAGVALAAVIPFDRFDPARWQRAKRRGKSSKDPMLEPSGELAAGVAIAADAYGGRVELTTSLSKLTDEEPRSRFWSTAVIEFKLLFKGRSLWWHLVGVGLAIASVSVKDEVFQRFMVPLLWLWPIFLWSGMGNHEKTHRTDRIVFSTAHLVRRQLPAAWLAGVMVAAATTGIAALRLIATSQWYLLFGWGVGVLFVPALALTLGVWTNRGRAFETLYFAVWLIGVLGNLTMFNFMGRTPDSAASGTPGYYLIVTAILLALAALGRQVQVASTRN